MKRILKWGCGGLIGLFVLLMVIGTLAGGNRQAQPEPTATTSQAAKVQPVAETKPTATVITIKMPSPLPSKPTAAPPTSTPPPPATNTPASSSLTEAKVTRVIDGDTIEVDIAGKKYTVRYIGVNTPETVDPRRPVQYYGKEASAKNKELVEGKAVRLEKDVSETDKYGRLLRYVYVGDTMINAELVRQGYAQSSSYPPDVKHQELFVKLQREAREAGRGLWANAPDPTPVQASAPLPTARPASSASISEAEGEWVTSSDRRRTEAQGEDQGQFCF